MAHSERFLNRVNHAKASIKECDVSEVEAKLKKNHSFTLIDVREHEEWAKGHIPKAIHICKGVIERDIESYVPNLDEEIILYCGGGFRSAIAAESLQKMGYKNVISMDGGFRQYKEMGFKIL